jgi:Rrf2 family protein
MAVNTRFATGVHALLLLAAEPDVLQTSEDVARKLNTNPVVVRRVFLQLQESGLVKSIKGPSGGTRLARPAKEITLADAYRALNGRGIFHPSPTGKPNSALEQALKSGLKALEKDLAKTTLSQLAKKTAKKKKR